MTVKDLTLFLSNYADACEVLIVQSENDNPLWDGIEIKIAVAIERSNGDKSIVFVPE